MIALSGFDNNEARHYLASAGYARVFDSGLGGEAGNFDSIALRSWPHVLEVGQIWPIEADQERRAREARQRERAEQNAAYKHLAPDECGRLLVAGKSVAVPFVGAVAAAFVIAELLRASNGGSTYHDLRLRICSIGEGPMAARMNREHAEPMQGVEFGRFAR
jgi:hypothetical protein